MRLPKPRFREHRRVYSSDKIGSDKYMLDGIALFLDRSCGSSLALLAPGRRSISYQALSDFVVRTSSILRAAGIAQTDLVATVLPDGPDMVSAFLAISSVATCAPLNP